MNLRHIDPRSTDWMDAMMDADDEAPRGSRRRTPEAGVAVGMQAQPTDGAAPPSLHAGGAPPPRSVQPPSR